MIPPIMGQQMMGPHVPLPIQGQPMPGQMAMAAPLLAGQMGMPGATVVVPTAVSLLPGQPGSALMPMPPPNVPAGSPQQVSAQRKKGSQEMTPPSTPHSPSPLPWHRRIPSLRAVGWKCTSVFGWAP